MPNESGRFDQVESMANIYVELVLPAEGEDDSASKHEVPVAELDVTKEVDIERIREGGLRPDGYAINSIDVDGSITFSGHTIRVTSPESNAQYNIGSLLMDGDGVPKPFDVQIIHQQEDVSDNEKNARVTTIQNCIINTHEYSGSSGDTTETSFEFIGQRVNGVL